ERAGHLTALAVLTYDGIVVVPLDYLAVGRVAGDDKEGRAVVPDALVLVGREANRLVTPNVVALAEVRHPVDRRLELPFRGADLLVRVTKGRLVFGAFHLLPGRHTVSVPLAPPQYTSG